MEAWCEHLRANGRAPKTLLGYRSLITCHINPALGRIPLAKLTGADLDRLQAGMADAGLADQTRRHVHTAMSAALRQAVRWGWLSHSPAIRATPPRVGHTEPAAPTVAELRQLIDAAESENPDLAALIFVAATTGARRGELCGLRWGDVELASARLTVRRSISDTPGQVVPRATKTGRQRHVSLDDATAAVLVGQRARALERCQAVGTTLGDGCYIWSQDADHSTPWRPDRVTATFMRLRTTQGLPTIRFHHLRHFAATMALAGGIDVRTVAGRLGHADASVTLRVYGHVLDDRDRAAADLLGRTLAP